MSLEQDYRRSRFFDGTALSGPLQTLLEMNWRKDEFAITGSAALYMLSSTALSRGHQRLIQRTPHDLDIIVTGDALKHARDIGVITESNIGRGYLISLQLDENKGDLLDITTSWPVRPEIKNANDLASITQEVSGLRVMQEQWVLELKDKFNRAKDRPDIAQASRAMFKSHLSSGSMGLLPKIKGLI